MTGHNLRRRRWRLQLRPGHAKLAFTSNGRVRNNAVAVHLQRRWPPWCRMVGQLLVGLGLYCRCHLVALPVGQVVSQAGRQGAASDMSGPAARPGQAQFTWQQHSCIPHRSGLACTGCAGYCCRVRQQHRHILRARCHQLWAEQVIQSHTAREALHSGRPRVASLNRLHHAATCACVLRPSAPRTRCRAVRANGWDGRQGRLRLHGLRLQEPPDDGLQRMMLQHVLLCQLNARWVNVVNVLQG